MSKAFHPTPSFETTPRSEAEELPGTPSSDQAEPLPTGLFPPLQGSTRGRKSPGSITSWASVHFLTPPLMNCDLSKLCHLSEPPLFHQLNQESKKKKF